MALLEDQRKQAIQHFSQFEGKWNYLKNIGVNARVTPGR